MRVRSATVPVPVDAPADFEALFVGEFSYVWNSLRRLGIHERDLEDTTHEVFLQVHRHWAAYDTSRLARPWLFGFCYRIAADYRRLARHRGTLVGDAADLDKVQRAAGIPADEQLVQREAVELVHLALDRLDFDQRAVFVLHDLDECSMKGVADSLRIPVNTGYSRLRLARARFAVAVRKIMARRGEFE
jgi:RNA polymerase sigma-70 factor (ECF subfamily)